jgi:hypothetical protein
LTEERIKHSLVEKFNVVNSFALAESDAIAIKSWGRARGGKMKNFTNYHQNVDERQCLYCVWIAASEQPGAPLVSVWIDPAMRALEQELQEVNCEGPIAAGVGHEREDESAGDAVIEDPPLRVHMPLMSASLT